MDDFKFYIPLKKDVNSINNDCLVGIASTLTVDRDEERMSDRALKMMVNDIRSMGVNLFGNHEHQWENTLGAIKEADLVDGKVNIKINLDDPVTNTKIPMLLNKLKRGINLGLSVGGSVTDEKYEYNSELGKKIKVIDGVKLFEISVVGIPSNSDSFVSLPSLISKSRKCSTCAEHKEVDKASGVCAWCSGEIKKTPIRAHGKKFCSYECADQWELTEMHEGRLKSVSKLCPICFGEVLKGTCSLCFFKGKEEFEFTEAEANRIHNKIFRLKRQGKSVEEIAEEMNIDVEDVNDILTEKSINKAQAKANDRLRILECSDCNEEIENCEGCGKQFYNRGRVVCSYGNHFCSEQCEDGMTSAKSITKGALPIVEHNGKKWFLDRRLGEMRNVNDPNDVLDYIPVEFQEVAKPKKKSINVTCPKCGSENVAQREDSNECLDCGFKIQKYCPVCFYKSFNIGMEEKGYGK